MEKYGCMGFGSSNDKESVVEHCLVISILLLGKLWMRLRLQNRLQRNELGPSFTCQNRNLEYAVISVC